jgi:FLVCR family MFS transporter 7
MDRDTLVYAKYADLILYFPMNFASIYIIENYGLKKCISLGSIIMILGSLLRFFGSFDYIWAWYFGHIVCMSSQAYLKSPTTKLASNWFGDKERGTATAIGIVSGPLGIFISKGLLLLLFDQNDGTPEYKGGTPDDIAKSHLNYFFFLHSLITIGMVVPALFLIREKPPSPPSMVATKPRPV